MRFLGGNRWVPDVALAFVTAIWGTTFVVNELVLKDAPPFLFLAIRFGLAAITLQILAAGSPRTKGLLRDSVWLGFFLAVSIGCQLAGQVYTTASKTAFITGLSVPLTPVVAFLFARKLPTVANLQGLVLAVIGFVILAWPSDMKGFDPGDVLVLITAICYAYLIFFMGETSINHNARSYAAGQITYAALFFILGRIAMAPFLPSQGALFSLESRPLPRTPGFIFSVLWMALAATVLTFLVQTWAQARMSATHAAIIFALEPVWTVVFASMLLGERMQPREIAGGVLILLGIFAAERGPGSR